MSDAPETTDKQEKVPPPRSSVKVVRNCSLIQERVNMILSGRDRIFKKICLN